MKIELPPLPYSYTALEPSISKTTLEVWKTHLLRFEHRFLFDFNTVLF